MRILITILLILSFGYSESQVINAHVRYRGFVSGFDSLLLDSAKYSNAAVAYSLRRLRNAYTGNCIRIRKDTTGQPEQDIGFSGGVVDTNAIKSFLNANSGFVVTWYDQSGNARNATQSTAGNQPRIALNGVIDRKLGKPFMFFGSSGTLFLEHVFSSNLSQPGTAFLTIEYTNTGSQVSIGSNNDATRWQMFRRGDGTNRLSIFAGGTLSDPNTSASPVIQYALFNGASSVTGVNGSVTSGNAGTNQISSVRIGTHSTTGLRGFISEYILYNSNNSTNRTPIESNINTFYAIY